MDVKFEPTKLFPAQIDVKEGSFALEATPISWETCRERFGKAFQQDTPGFYFKHRSGGGRAVASFLVKTESVLRQEPSRFAETNRDSVLWIEPSDFWKSCPMRRSLLTVLLRCGIVYDPARDNYEEALFTQEYVVPTRRAIMRFLFGFTQYQGPSLATDSTIQIRGWKSIFEGKTEADIKQWLVWPNGKPYTPALEMPLALWV